MRLLFLTGAILSICVAHYIRVLRWHLFIDIYEESPKQNLIKALSVGFLLNYILPYKLGDFCRAWMAGQKMKNGKPLALSTVIMDRYLDIICVGVIFIFLFWTKYDSEVILHSALFYIIAAVILILISALVYCFRSVLKKCIRFVASLFNARIEAAILHFAWALIWNFKDMFQKINKWKLLITTVIMWVLYLLSYLLYGTFLNTLGGTTSWIDIFVMLFAESGIKASTLSIPLWGNAQIAAHPFYLIIYMVSPLILMLAYSTLAKPAVSNQANEDHLNLLPQLDPKERLAFLENYFSDINREYVTNYLKINQDVSIIRDYSAGSNATTMLCMDGENTFFRKYAFGEDGDKLYQQILWIEANQNQLPLPKILKQEKKQFYCYYDMPYSSNAVGLFEYVHSMPVEKSWLVIRMALESLENSAYRMNFRPSDQETIRNYIRSKVIHNLETIRSAKYIRNLMKYDTILINGTEYQNLPYYEKFLTEAYLQKIFSQDTYAVIHGDLTIENIICQRDQHGVDDYYIIDPNTGNIHESPNLDYGKLLQSIHGGYEFLMSTRSFHVEENRIDFLFTKSSAYMELHKLLRSYMQETFGDTRTRSIYFHEIIHWLRLIPYKIEKDEKRAVLFYAGLLMVMHDVISMYGSNKDA